MHKCLAFAMILIAVGCSQPPQDPDPKHRICHEPTFATVIAKVQETKSELRMVTKYAASVRLVPVYKIVLDNGTIREMDLSQWARVKEGDKIEVDFKIVPCPKED